MKERCVRMRVRYFIRRSGSSWATKTTRNPVTDVVIHTIEIPIPDKMEFEKYLRASEAKEMAPKYSRMEYDFPEIKEACPVCGDANCAQWRGYHRRFIFCAEMEELKRIFIHVGRCRKTRESFTAAPSFLFQTGE